MSPRRNIFDALENNPPQPRMPFSRTELFFQALAFGALAFLAFWAGGL